MPPGPAFLAPVAGRGHAKTTLPVASARCIDALADAKRVVAKGQAGVVMIARAMLAGRRDAR